MSVADYDLDLGIFGIEIVRNSLSLSSPSNRVTSIHRVVQQVEFISCLICLPQDLRTHDLGLHTKESILFLTI